MRISLAEIVSGLTTVGGAIGAVLTAVGLTDLATPERVAVTAICGLLTAIGSHHAGSIVSARAQASQPSQERREPVKAV